MGDRCSRYGERGTRPSRSCLATPPIPPLSQAPRRRRQGRCGARRRGRLGYAAVPCHRAVNVIMPSYRPILGARMLVISHHHAPIYISVPATILVENTVAAHHLCLSWPANPYVHYCRARSPSLRPRKLHRLLLSEYPVSLLLFRLPSMARRAPNSFHP